MLYVNCMWLVKKKELLERKIDKIKSKIGHPWKEDTLLRIAKRHLSSSSDVEKQKNKPVALAIVKFHKSEGISQSVSQSVNQSDN